MNEQALIRKMEQARESVFDLPNGKRLTLRLPLQTQYNKVFRAPPEEVIAAVVVGWEGVTEADLLGESVGAADPVPFTPALAVQWLCDQPDVVSAVLARAIELANARAKQAADDEKN